MENVVKTNKTPALNKKYLFTQKPSLVNAFLTSSTCFYKEKVVAGFGILNYNMYKVLLIVQFEFPLVKT